MQEVYAKLKSEWLLRGWTNFPYALLNWKTGDVRQLTVKGAYVAKACDGKTDFFSLAFLPEHRNLLHKLIEDEIAVICSKGDSIEESQCFHKAENPFIRAVHWCVTGRCNLKCRHCYLEAPSGKYGELSFEDIAAIIDQFNRANVSIVAISGGEPFYRPDILEIIELLTKKKICLYQIYTNGTLIKAEHLQVLKALGLSPSFHLSYDGFGKHDQIRGIDGNEAQVIETIKLLRHNGFSVMVTTVIDKTNINSLLATYDLLKGLGIEYWKVAPPMEVGNWRSSATALSVEEEINGLAVLPAKWLEDGKPLAIKLSSYFIGSKQSAADGPLVKHSPDGYDCSVCREKPSVQPDGTIMTCPMYVDTVMHKKMPNLLQTDISNVLRDSLVSTMANLKKKDLFARNPECVACELFGDCGMGCRATAIRITKDPLAKDPVACEYWKNGYRKIFTELAGLKL